jgi:LysM repeat protein
VAAPPKKVAAPRVTKAPAKPITKPVKQAKKVVKPTGKIAPQPAPVAPETAPAFYVVKAGETLYSIGRRYGMTAEKLCQINGLAANCSVKVGQQIKVNDCECAIRTDLVPKGGAPTTYNQPNRTVGLRRTHTVQEGENLPSIARMYNISVAHIRELNRMAPNEIVIPMQVIIVD